MHPFLRTLACLVLVAVPLGAATAQESAPQVVEISATGLQFLGPDRIAPGWTTFRFANASAMTHFAAVQRLPEGIHLRDHQADVAPVFQAGMDLLAEGEFDAAMEAFGGLPAWFSEVVFLGGPGLIGPNRSGEATVFLEAGTYLIECYVKTDGVFHSYNPDPHGFGMVMELEVAGDTTAAAEPTADIRISVSSTDGFEISGDLGAGVRTVAVTYEDQIVHENFVGHDVHLVRLEDGTDLDALEAWMNWSMPGGLDTPAPATFVGGLNEMPAGATGYFSVSLESGSYAWIAEVPDAEEKGMFVPFDVP